MIRASKLATWAAVLLLCSTPIAGTARADGNARIDFPISVFFPNPCNSENVSLHGAVDVMYHTNAAGGGAHYSVHVEFKGKGSGNQGNDYVVSLIANGNFERVCSVAHTTIGYLNGGSKVNTDQMKGNWKQFVGKAKENWRQIDR